MGADFLSGLLGGFGSAFLDHELTQHKEKVADAESRKRILENVMNNPDTKPEDRQAILKILLTPSDEKGKGKGKGKQQGGDPLQEFLGRLGGIGTGEKATPGAGGGLSGAPGGTPASPAPQPAGEEGYFAPREGSDVTPGFLQHVAGGGGYPSPIGPIPTSPQRDPMTGKYPGQPDESRALSVPPMPSGATNGAGKASPAGQPAQPLGVKPMPTQGIFKTQAQKDDEEFAAWKRREDVLHQNRMEESQDKGPTTIEAAWLKSFKNEKGREPTSEEIQAHYTSEREKPLDAEVAKGIELAKGGDLEGAKKIFDAVQAGATARKGNPTTGTSLMAMIVKANSGDPSAKEAVSSYMKMQNELASSRGAGYGAGRAMYQIGAYIDGDTGQMIPLSNYDAIQRIRAGQTLIPSGRLPASVTLGAQRLVSEAAPAIKEVRDNLKAYDNSSDRAIFARVMTSAGKPAYGQESSWFGNVLNQTATEQLSPEGKALVVRLARLNETIGTLRQTLGSPATDSSMALMLGLLPGPSTPDSKMASDMIDMLEQNVTNAIQVPALKGVGGKKATLGVPPMPGAAEVKPKGRVIKID